MNNFRMKIQEEIKQISIKMDEGTPLTEEELKVVFLASFIKEEENEQ